MVVTGCTYGKSNIEKTYYNKMAFTLIDVQGKRSVRVSLKPEFFARMLRSPFVEQRKQGVPPQDIVPEVADPLVEKVMTMPEEVFLDIGPITACEFTRKAGVFDAESCSQCGEMVFVDKLIDTGISRICLGCKNKAEKGD